MGQKELLSYSTVVDPRTVDQTSEKTTIEVSTATWQELNRRKRGPGDTFDAVIRRLLAESEE